MTHYFVDKTPLPGGAYELHQEQCQYIPSRSHRIYVGSFSDERAAIMRAEKIFHNVHVCPHCCIHFHRAARAHDAMIR
ncbi:hypothetical protein [Celerinatantimonas sp. YJH-8]|uniref:hypothetical protein n=1 Tax=Celerinatantimonas sp. YJH-8 TaxID=3228714 RepID=UPI0038C2CD1E